MSGYLVVKPTSPVGVYRASITSTALLGTAAGSAMSWVAGDWPGANTSCRYRGATFEATADSIRRSIDDGQTWTIVHTFSPVQQTADSRALFGPQPFYNNGVPLLAVIWVANVGNIAHCTTSTDGITWTDTNLGVATPASSWGGTLVSGSSLFIVGAGSSGWIINPFTLTISAITGTSTHGARYGINWNGVAYFTAYGAVSGLFSLFALNGGAAAIVQNIFSDVSVSRSAIIVDQATNDLIVFSKRNIAQSVRAWRIGQAPSYTVTEITASVITGGAMATGSTIIFAGVMYDQDSNPGGAPVIYLLVGSNSQGSLVSAFRWNGVSALMGDAIGNANDTGGAIEMSWPDKTIGGERNFTARAVGVNGATEILNTGKGNTTGTFTRRKFRLYKPRSQVLTTIGGAPATYDLVTTPLSSTPLQSGNTTIRGVINGVNYVATDLNATGVLAGPATTIAAGSSGVALPVATINVASTNVRPTFPSAGRILVTTDAGVQTVTYTGITGTTFTGCTGGTGTMSTGGAVTGPLLPVGGTIDYATGAMTGVTATLDAGSTVEALFVGGTADHQWFRATAANEYPGATVKAPLSSPTSGTISSDDNINCLADASEQQINVDMVGFVSGDRFSIDPRGVG